MGETTSRLKVYLVILSNDHDNDNYDDDNYDEVPGVLSSMLQAGKYWCSLTFIDEVVRELMQLKAEYTLLIEEFSRSRVDAQIGNINSGK